MSIYYLICLKPIISRYDWIALLDVDEVIVPRKHKSWSKMMEEVNPQAKDFSRWSFKNIYFLDNMTDNLPEPNLHKDVPAALHMMNHVYRYFPRFYTLTMGLSYPIPPFILTHFKP